MLNLFGNHIVGFPTRRLKCYGGQTCAEITQGGAGSDAVWETIPISDGSVM